MTPAKQRLDRATAMLNRTIANVESYEASFKRISDELALAKEAREIAQTEYDNAHEAYYTEEQD